MDVDVLALIISIISLLATVVLTVYGFVQNSKFEKYEHEAQNQTKKDILSLLGALNLIVSKGSVTVYCKNLSIKDEKSIIQNFLTSTTCISLQQYFYTSETENVFLVCLILIIDGKDNDIASAAGLAKRAIIEINKFGPEFMKSVNEIQSDFEAIFPDFSNYKMKDSMTRTMYDAVERANDKKTTELKSKLTYLKRHKRIDDPNIDMFLGVIENDFDVVKEALESGANASVTANEIFEKYKTELEGYAEIAEFIV